MPPEEFGSVKSNDSRNPPKGSVGEGEREMEASEAMNSFPRGPQGLHELAFLTLFLLSVLCKFPDCMYSVSFSLMIFSYADPSVGNSLIFAD